MRSLSTTQKRLLSTPAGYTQRARVLLLGPNGTTWYNLSFLFDRDFLEGVDVDESLEAPVAQATVRLTREVHGVSLAPLVAESRANNLAGTYSPLVAEGRAFRVEVALSPLGGVPGAGDWLPLFHGRVDSVDAGGDGLVFKGRDGAGVLQDVQVPEATYGSTAGTPLQSVCQSLLNDSRLSAFGLYVLPSDLAWDLGPYRQLAEPVMDALGKLATARGAELRWKLRPDTGDWGLWLWVPDRAGTTPAWTYGPQAYTALGQVSSDIADVRTRVEVVYSDSADKDAAGQPKRKVAWREDVAATQRYGILSQDGTWVPRTMRVAEAATSNIRTEAAAARLAEAGLADLSTPPLEVSVEVAVHPGLELADLVALEPNGVHFTTPQVLAVRQVTHSLSSSGAKTRLVLKGRPSISPRAWLEAESRPGVAPSPPFTGPPAPSALVVTNAITGAVLLFTAPDGTTGPAPAQYELHLGTTPGFTLSNASLRAVSDSTSFSLQALSPGATYYARVRSRDAKGNVGPASAEAVISPRYLGPSATLPTYSFLALPLNGDFEAQSDAAAPPDGCAMVAGTWGTHALVDGGFAYSGGRSLRFTARTESAGGTRLGFQPFAALTGDRFAVRALFYAAQGGTVAGLYVTWLDAGFSSVGTPATVQAQAISSGAWRTFSGYVTVPAAARYGRVEVGAIGGAGGELLWVDSVAVQPSLIVRPAHQTLRHPSLGGNLTDYENGWKPQPTFPVRYRLSAEGMVEIIGTMTAPAMPAGASTAFTLPVGYRPFQVVLVRTHNQGTVMSVYLQTDGMVTVVGATGNSDIPLDGVRFQPA